MSKNPADVVSRMFDDLVAAGRWLGAEARAGRPDDQPAGAGARLSAVHWYLSPVGGVEVQNLDALFTGGTCAQCFVPLGVRTRRRMTVRHSDAPSRRSDGVLAQLPEQLKGPTFHLFSERFRERLSAAERRPFRWRAVDVSNPTKATLPLFEVVASEVHVQAVALRGSNPDRDWCPGCGRHGPPAYPLAGGLPDWLNPGGEPAGGARPRMFVAADSLPDPAPPWFTVGEWTRGVYLGMSCGQAWPERPRPGTVGIHVEPLGAVGPDLIDPGT